MKILGTQDCILDKNLQTWLWVFLRESDYSFSVSFQYLCWLRKQMWCHHFYSLVTLSRGWYTCVSLGVLPWVDRNIFSFAPNAHLGIFYFITGSYCLLQWETEITWWPGTLKKSKTNCYTDIFKTIYVSSIWDIDIFTLYLSSCHYSKKMRSF